MATSTQEYEGSLRISPQPVILALFVPALGITLFAFRFVDSTTPLIHAVVLYATASVLFALQSRLPELTRYLTLGVQVALLISIALMFDYPGALFLVGIPVGCAAGMLGTGASVLTASAQTLALVMLAWQGHVDWANAALALLINWSTVLLFWAIARPVRTLAFWSYERYDRSRALLDEARNRQAELKDALDSLAHANRELALAHDLLAAMRLAAEEAARSKAAFVSNVSHEFRSPLNIIIGLAEVLMNPQEAYGYDLPPGAGDDVAVLYRNCEHLAGLVDDVLDLSRIEAGRLALRREWVDLGALVHTAISIVQPLADKKTIYLNLDAPRELPKVYCDPRRIRQVILNLVSNATRFTEVGGITVAVDVDDEHVQISVTDTGPGISPEDAERIFQPFEQSAESPSAPGSGSGLGLAISKQFVKMHDGDLWMQSEPGAGSTLTFRLPVQPLAGPSSNPQRWIVESWSQRSSHTALPDTQLGDRVVLYDATREFSGVLQRYADDIEFVEADSIEAVAATLDDTSAHAALINEEAPEILLRAINRIKQEAPDAPVIGCSVPDRAIQAISAGAEDYMVKPISHAALAEMIERVAPEAETILIIDDDPDTRHVMQTMLPLVKPEVQVWEASSGAEAIALLGTRLPDLIMLDLIMPEMDGWGFLAAKKQHKAWRGVPTILISAQDIRDEPLVSGLLVGTLGRGISIGKLLRCSRELANLLLQPD